MLTIKSSEFVKSSPNMADCPKPDMPEYAFIGRSNVGKSSLINMLTSRKNLAKTSSTPGKTQLINHFIINGQWYLVDLPGYGWAQVSKSSKKQWKKMISEYLYYRENLANVFLLVDSRHEPLKADLEFIRDLGQNGIPFTIIMTKTDKLGKTGIQKSLAKYKKVLKIEWEEVPPIFISSSSTGAGREELLGYIDQINNSIVR